MRIALDTNVVMSALLWRGKPFQLLEVIVERPDLQLFTSATLLEELADSGDSDLTSMGRHQDIEIVSAAMALEALGKDAKP